ARHAVAESPRAQRRRPRPTGRGIHPLGEDSAVVLGIHHVGIVVKQLRDAYTFYRSTLGLPLLREAEVADQGVRAALLGAGDTEIELLEPLDPENAVGRFLAKRGEGLHHFCLDTPSVDAKLSDLRRRAVPLIDHASRQRLAGRIAFQTPPPQAAGRA